MKKFKDVIRLFIFVMFLVMASFGLGIGNIFSNRERYMDTEIRTEQVEKREEDDDGGDEEKT